MKRFLRALLLLVLVAVMCFTLTACKDEETTTTTETKPPLPKEYTAKEAANTLNYYFGELSAVLSEDDSSFLLDDISLENIIVSGIEGIDFDMLYKKDGLTYTKSDGKVYIEKEKDGLIAYISEDGQYVSIADNGGSLMIDPSLVLFDEEDIKLKKGNKNIFTIKGEAVPAILNMIEGDNIYDEDILSDVSTEIDMTDYEAEGIILINVTFESSGKVEVTLKLTADYENEKGTITLICENEVMKHRLMVLKGDNNAVKVEYDGEASIEDERITARIRIESKGDAYSIPDGASAESWDAETYDLNVKKNNETIVRMELNGGRVGDKVKGCIDLFMGEGASDMGGIGLLSSENETEINGSFEITLNKEEISTLSAELSMSYYLISGDVSIIYSADGMKQVGATPLTVRAEDGSTVSTITLKTVSYESGQGKYKLSAEEGEASLTADISIPAIKTFQLTEREQLLLERADLYLDDAENVIKELKAIEKATLTFAEDNISYVAENEPYIYTAAWSGRYYVSHYYLYEGYVFYEIQMPLDFDLVKYSYVENSGSLSNIVKGDHKLYNDIYALWENHRDAWNEEGINWHNSNRFVAGFYVESVDCYVYFSMYDISDFAATRVELGPEDFDIPLHMYDLDALEDSVYYFHNEEKVYEGGCRSYKCTVCDTTWGVDTPFHEYEETKIRELTDTQAEIVSYYCINCKELKLKHTDGDGNSVYTTYKEISAESAEKYAIPKISTNIVLNGMQFIGGATEFNMPIEIPVLTDKIGKTVVGAEDAPAVNVGKKVDLILPEGLIFLGERSLKCAEIRTVVLPSTLKYCEDYVGFEYVTELIIPENVVYFGRTMPLSEAERVVINAKDLTTLYVPDIKDYSNIEYNCESIDNLVFYRYLSQERIVIPSGTRSFSGLTDNSSVKELILPYGLEEIPDNALEGCSGITELILPDTVSYIGKEAFAGSGLKTVKLLRENGAIEGEESKILLPEGIKVISDGVFKGAKATDVVIHEGVTEIGNEAFQGSLVENIQFPSSLERIGNNAFYSCGNLNDDCLVFGDNLKELGVNLFYGNWQIKELVLPESLESFDLQVIGATNMDRLVIKGSPIITNNIPTYVEVKEATLYKLLENGDSYYWLRASTVNLNITEYKTLPPINELSACISTINFSGTEQQFVDAGFTNIPEGVTVNYNVSFE